ncbi:hypothetical protein CPSG_05593 [Coccidioides posadasii str. Silveira]|uniref:Uncharacterized protein n=1 Tax=Coccidioides posadasii (strain RMSCC 757 / Silveira) TaxID=443226 RepID=E9D6T4_COCPS|nr:hypothetical protein CPSG_05593 [Coccidioides posadasii str. Silveira]
MEDDVVLEGSVVTIVSSGRAAIRTPKKLTLGPLKPLHFFELHSFAPAVAYPWRIRPALCSITRTRSCCGGRLLGGVHFVCRGLFGSATLDTNDFMGCVFDAEDKQNRCSAYSNRFPSFTCPRFYEVDGRFERVSDGPSRAKQVCVQIFRSTNSEAHTKYIFMHTKKMVYSVHSNP